MTKKRSWGLSLLAQALAVGLLLLAPGAAFSNDFETPLSNLDLVSTNLEAYTFAKLDARGHLDGHILYTGCYLPDQCFRVVDVKDPENLVLLASPPVFDPVESPAPRLGQPTSSPEYKTWFSTDPSEYLVLVAFTQVSIASLMAMPRDPVFFGFSLSSLLPKSVSVLGEGCTLAPYVSMTYRR